MTRAGIVAELSVSVIVIVKDGARFLRQALGSIGQAQVPAGEILVIDGGSSDDSVEIATKFPGARVIRQTAGGISGAYNEGIAAAGGSILTFLSADDLWLPQTLGRHVAAFAQDPELLLSVGLVEHFLEPGAFAPPGFRPGLLGEARPAMLMEGVAVRRAAFDRIGLFDPGYSTAEDTDWFARAIDAGLKMKVLPEVLVRKRIHGNNASLIDPQGNKNRLRALRASLSRKRAAGALCP